MKNRSYHWCLRTNDQQDCKTWYDWKDCKIAKYRNQSKGRCTKAIAKYEKSLSREVKTIPKAFFKYAPSKLNYSQTIPDLKDGNKTISDNCEKAKAFNMFFTSVFTKETDTLQNFILPVRILLIRSPLLLIR